MKTKQILASVLVLSLLAATGLAQNTGPVQYQRDTLMITPSNTLSSNFTAGAGITLTKGTIGKTVITGTTVAKGTNVILVTNGSVVTVHGQPGSGISVAQGTNIITVTNGSVVTVHGQPGTDSTAALTYLTNRTSANTTGLIGLTNDTAKVAAATFLTNRTSANTDGLVALTNNLSTNNLLSIVPTNGQLLLTGTNKFFPLVRGTDGQVLKMDGTNVTWGTDNAAAGTAGTNYSAGNVGATNIAIVAGSTGTNATGAIKTISPGGGLTISEQGTTNIILRAETNLQVIGLGQLTVGGIIVSNWIYSGESAYWTNGGDTYLDGNLNVIGNAAFQDNVYAGTATWANNLVVTNTFTASNKVTLGSVSVAGQVFTATNAVGAGKWSDATGLTQGQVDTRITSVGLTNDGAVLYANSLLAQSSTWYPRPDWTNSAAGTNHYILSRYYSTTNMSRVFPLAGTDNYIFSFSTTNHPFTFLAPGAAVVEFSMKRSNGGGDAATVKPEIYFSVGGVTYVEFPDASPVTLTDTEASYRSTVVIPTNIFLAANSELVLKFKVMTQTSTPDITIYAGSNSVTAVTIPFPAALVPPVGDGSGLTNLQDAYTYARSVTNGSLADWTKFGTNAIGSTASNSTRSILVSSNFLQSLNGAQTTNNALTLWGLYDTNVVGSTSSNATRSILVSSNFLQSLNGAQLTNNALTLWALYGTNVVGSTASNSTRTILVSSNFLQSLNGAVLSNDASPLKIVGSGDTTVSSNAGTYTISSTAGASATNFNAVGMNWLTVSNVANIATQTVNSLSATSLTIVGISPGVAVFHSSDTNLTNISNPTGQTRMLAYSNDVILWHGIPSGGTATIGTNFFNAEVSNSVRALNGYFTNLTVYNGLNLSTAYVANLTTTNFLALITNASLGWLTVTNLTNYGALRLSNNSNAVDYIAWAGAQAGAAANTNLMVYVNGTNLGNAGILNLVAASNTVIWGTNFGTTNIVHVAATASSTGTNLNNFAFTNALGTNLSLSGSLTVVGTQTVSVLDVTSLTIPISSTGLAVFNVNSNLTNFANGAGVLTNNGSGLLSWVAVGGGSGGGLTTNTLQFDGAPLSIKDGAVLTNITVYTNLNVDGKLQVGGLALTPQFLLWGFGAANGSVWTCTNSSNGGGQWGTIGLYGITNSATNAFGAVAATNATFTNLSVSGTLNLSTANVAVINATNANLASTNATLHNLNVLTNAMVGGLTVTNGITNAGPYFIQGTNLDTHIANIAASVAPASSGASAPAFRAFPLPTTNTSWGYGKAMYAGASLSFYGFPVAVSSSSGGTGSSIPATRTNSGMYKILASGSPAYSTLQAISFITWSNRSWSVSAGICITNMPGTNYYQFQLVNSGSQSYAPSGATCGFYAFETNAAAIGTNWLAQYYNGSSFVSADTGLKTTNFNRLTIASDGTNVTWFTNGVAFQSIAHSSINMTESVGWYFGGKVQNAAGLYSMFMTPVECWWEEFNERTYP